jgi:mannose-6-phosphate isomerase-like protein (cupin superfamily)
MSSFDRAAFEKCNADSIDYALFEKTKNAAAVKTDIGWSDLGSWKSIFDISPKDTQGNSVHAKDFVSYNSKNIQVFCEDQKKVISAIGLDNVTIVDSEDALLILNNEKSQDVRKIVSALEFDEKDQISSLLVTEYWGTRQVRIERGEYRVTEFSVLPEKEIYYPTHEKSLHILVEKGVGEFVYDDSKSLLEAGNSFMSHAHNNFKIRNTSKKDNLQFIKIEM